MAFITALGCGLAFWYLNVSGRTISPIWPAAGVAVAFFQFFGRRALVPLMVGHLAIWWVIDPRQNWPIFLIPLLYPLEAWFVVWLGNMGKSGSQQEDRTDLCQTAWRLLGAPVLGCIPLAIIVSVVLTWTGRFKWDALGASFFLLMISHAHGIIALGPLTLHLLQRKFILPEVRWSLKGLFAGLAGLTVMSLAISGAFEPFITHGTALYLPFPLMVMAAIWLPPAPVSLLIAIWCVIATAFNSIGPLAMDSMAGRSLGAAELAIYNMTLAAMAYLMSVGSTRLRRQLNLNEIAMTAAGIELWEWESGKGFAWSDSGHPDPTESDGTRFRPLEKDPGRLVGVSLESPETPDAKDLRGMRLIDDGAGNGHRPFDSIGKVLARGRDGRPLQAIGLLKDPCTEQRTEEALQTPGYQKALLRSLQAKLNPHFLFNSLNVIRALVHVDAERADEAITSLASLLRNSLHATEVSLIALGDEVKSIRSLDHLARLRFGTRLTTSIDIPDELLEALVPPMLLLNLVENAITHGIGNMESGGKIAVQARTDPAGMHMHVRNTGILPESVTQGVGIRDARQRLKLLYGDKATLSLTQLDEATVSADLRIPFNTLAIS